MNRKLGLSIKRNSSPAEKREYWRARAELLKQDPEWVAARRAREAKRRKENPERIAEQQKRWLMANRERRAQIVTGYLARNRELLNAKQRAKNKTPARKEFMRRYVPKHRKENPDLYATYFQNRRARIISAQGSHSEAEWQSLLASHSGLCAYCRDAKATARDHVIPLARGGSNSIGNILPACGPCNSAKGTLTADEFLRRRKGEGVSIDDRWLAQLATARAIQRAGRQHAAG